MRYRRTIFVILFILSLTYLLLRIFEKEDKVKINLDKPIKSESYKILNEDNDTNLLSIDNFISRFIRREGLKGGASVAISKDGKLVYAKGYGYSNIEDTVVLQPYNTMRIASVSKLVTAVAVFKLIEDGKLGLHQNVFGVNGILNDSIYLHYKDSRMDSVTVYRLLNHSAGWTARWGDPMFMPHAIARQMNYSLPISMKDIIVFMHNRWMHFTPGTSSVYSNFGYGILGEVVSKVSGQPYEEYVKNNILSPLGIYDMSIGFSDKDKRLKNEVYYYEADSSHTAFDYRTDEKDSVRVRRAYGGTDIQTLGSAGGWVASATDLLKLVLVIDGFDNVHDILNKKHIEIMTTSEKGFDPLGWRYVHDNNWYRSGTLAATSAMVSRRSDGVCYVVLFNSANHRGPDLSTSIRVNIDKIIDNINHWPKTDLLEKDTLWQRYNANNF